MPQPHPALYLCQNSLLLMDPAPSSANPSFTEELEWLALQHQSVEIIYRAQNGARCVIRERIAGLTHQDGEPSLYTANGLAIKLTSLLEVNGRKAPNGC
jgi:hypothetical protein